MDIQLNGTVQDVKARVVEALKAQGFGILTEIDVQQTFKQKLDVDFKPYLILGACNPSLAHRSLSTDESIGLLLPCNVVLKQDGGAVTVSIMDPDVMFSVVGPETKRALADLPGEAKRLLRAALEALKAPA
jgi:uncharacterized protein (DUF302 family)